MSAFVESIDRARQAAAPRAHDVPSGPLAIRLEAMRANGFAAFEAQGLPTRRDERWKGTNVSKIADLAFERAGASDDTGNAFANDPRVAAFEPDLLFVDGRMVQASAGRADLPEGIRSSSYGVPLTPDNDGKYAGFDGVIKLGGVWSLTPGTSW